MNIQLVVIDPQNDFCDPGGSLFVPGADADMSRLAALVDRLRGGCRHPRHAGHRRKVDISHPMWWRERCRQAARPVHRDHRRRPRAAGASTTARPELPMRVARLSAARSSAAGRYPHMIWPYHCLIGDGGHSVLPTLAARLHEWEQRFAMVDFITKGSNPWTEHFSAVQAEVPDPERSRHPAQHRLHRDARAGRHGAARR